MHKVRTKIDPSDDVRLSSPTSLKGFLIHHAETHFRVFWGCLSHLHIL